MTTSATMPMKIACAARRVSSSSRVTNLVPYILCCTKTVGQIGTEAANNHRWVCQEPAPQSLNCAVAAITKSEVASIVRVSAVASATFAQAPVRRSVRD